jgi:hypothetical protein
MFCYELAFGIELTFGTWRSFQALAEQLESLERKNAVKS